MEIRCPTCDKEAEVPEGFRWRPFCSSRCQMADLGAWLDESYRISRPLRDDDLAGDELLERDELAES